MRIRSIKPEFFEDEELAELTPHARLFFIGTWMMADKNGVLENRPKLLQARIFPYESGATADVSRLIPTLVSGGYLASFDADGKSYLWIPTFHRHQRITGKEAQGGGRYPEPPNDLQPVKQRGNNGETSEKHPGAQEQGAGNREQGTGSRVRFTAPTASEVREYMDSRNESIDADRFVDFYSSKGWVVGKTKMKDWKAAARGWYRRDKDRQAQPTTGSRKRLACEEQDAQWPEPEVFDVSNVP